MFTQKNRDRFSGQLGEAVRDEFDNLQGQLSTAWLKEHAADGSHRFPAGDIVPVGLISMWAGDTAPNSKWLFCRGQQVSRTTYLALFQIFGTTYGAGDGSTTFNLPDLQQRFPLGKAASGTGSSLGDTGGAIDHTHSGGSHTHSIASGGSHGHTVDSHTHTIPGDSGHSHTVNSHDHSIDGDAGAIADPGGLSPGSVISGAGHDHNGVTGSASPGTDTAGAHSHGGDTGSTAPDTNTTGAHDHGGSTGSSGAGTTGANNPPYLVLNFCVFSGVAVG